MSVVIAYESDARETEAGARRKTCKHWGGLGAIELLVASAKMDSPFVRCHEEGGYQRRLFFWLAEVRRRLEVPTVVTPDLLALPEDYRHLYYAKTGLTERVSFCSSVAFMTTRGFLVDAIMSNIPA